MEEERTYTAFAGEHLVGAGGLRAMLGKVKAYLDDGGEERVLIFEDWTGRQVDFDFRGPPEEVFERADPSGPRTGPGRPKLGVVAREVTLLPRHWEWLERQPSGASAALRRLVDEARKREPGKERARLALEAASKVMWAVAGDLPNFEEASRALFGRDQARFEKLIAAWPKDLRKHLARLVREAEAMEETPAPGG